MPSQPLKPMVTLSSLPERTFSVYLPNLPSLHVLHTPGSLLLPWSFPECHTSTCITVYPIFFPKVLRARPCERTQWSEATPARSCDSRILPHQAPGGPCLPALLCPSCHREQDFRISKISSGGGYKCKMPGVRTRGETGLRGQKSRLK